MRRCKRPVDAEEILDAVKKKAEEAADPAARQAWLEAFAMVMGAPVITFERPAIVRCADCKWYEAEEGTRKGTCRMLERERVWNFYCANGAREDMVMPEVVGDDVSWKL